MGLFALQPDCVEDKESLTNRQHYLDLLRLHLRMLELAPNDGLGQKSSVYCQAVK